MFDLDFRNAAPAVLKNNLTGHIVPVKAQDILNNEVWTSSIIPTEGGIAHGSTR